MNPTQYQQYLPILVDLQPEPEEKLLRLPSWMKYLFVALYFCALVGLGFLLKEGFYFFKLYQAKVQALRIAEETTKSIMLINQQLSENKAAQATYEQFKLKQRRIARPGPLLEWVPLLIGRAQRAHNITIQQANDRVQIRVTLEKPSSDPVETSVKPPADYQVLSATEETPKYNDLPANQRPNPNNEYAALLIQLRKP